MSNLVLITGSTDGIGKQTALDLAELGYDILIHGRNEQKCETVTNEIKLKFPKLQIEYVVADLSIPQEIRRMSEEIHSKFSSINILINNAGIIENTRIIDKNNIEKTFMVNHLAPFYLTLLLLDLIRKGRPSRIINVSSQVHASSLSLDNLQGEINYSGRKAYGLSKLGNILFTNELARRLNDNHITVNSLHPGVFDTNLLRNGWNMRGSSIINSSKTILHIATSDEGMTKTGKYFSNQAERVPKSIALDEEIQKKMWKVSEKLLNIDSNKFLQNI
ncbi:MAG: SDR family oxidoreductase [Candidatus Kariarchaeaceae archaeon]|jgi:NAD(P)-dependent dehydrogenase (short-subunit alcohol dehydrogenase family)